VLRAVVLTQYQRVTDGQTDGIAIASTALAMLALRRAVKIAKHAHLFSHMSKDNTQPLIHFTARRNARIASAVLAAAIPSVCPSVRLSVTRRYCVKRMARSTVHFALTDSKTCLVLYKPKNIPQGRLLPPEILAPSDLPPPEGCEF